MSSLEFGAASTINIQHDHDIQHDTINQHTDDKIQIYDTDTDNNDIIEGIQNFGGEDSLVQQSKDQGTPDSLRAGKKIIYDVATVEPARTTCEEKKPEMVRDTEEERMMCKPPEKSTVAKIQDGNYFASLHSE